MWLRNWELTWGVADPFRVELAAGVTKDLKKLRHASTEAALQLMKLETDPQCGHALVGDLQGYRALEFNLKGSGAYRAIYRIDEAERVVIVYMVGPHENFYIRAKRRIQEGRFRG